MSDSSTPADRQHWHAQAGDLLADDYNVPGIIACGIGLVGLACTLVAAGSGHLGWAVVAGIATAVFLLGGLAALMFEHRREERIELAYGRSGHAPGHLGPQRYSVREIAMPNPRGGLGT
ncbi:hypothetical protein BOX37_16750 [Nocardia mangyaensis]|uniref:UsfY protein n=1 Tax=Nocardia mangyaensis TaxID=2213200 RepID=A0A1J0VTI6_9NOCA|nr:hypothetical protein [Nocardia mangyaensis]APE35322.1 hypothetical protein BOX37_16750 [Nocardia mangyaensis]